MRYSRYPLQIKQPQPPSPLRVYRLEVTYPDVDTMLELMDEGRHFPWNRRYLSYSGAHSRAQIFRSLGCHVRVVRSKLVEWE